MYDETQVKPSLCLFTATIRKSINKQPKKDSGKMHLKQRSNHIYKFVKRKETKSLAKSYFMQQHLEKWEMEMRGRLANMKLWNPYFDSWFPFVHFGAQMKSLAKGSSTLSVPNRSGSIFACCVYFSFPHQFSQCFAKRRPDEDISLSALSDSN